MGFSSATVFSVEEVLSNLSFVVPEFQRGYAWNEDQWQALWDDLVAISRRPRAHHYAGAIMVSEQQGSSTVELIDGQQRLITVALLLSALGASAHAIEFKSNEALQTYFDRYALRREHLAPRLAQYRSYYATNLANAFEYFAAKAAGLSQEEKPQLTSALLRQFKLFVLVIQPVFDVHVAFETINSRGKPLSTLERLKNRLIYIAMNAEDQAAGSEAAAEVHRCWKSVYTWLGAGKVLLDDDQFLRVHSIGWFRHARKSDWLTSQLFEETFSTHSGVQPHAILEYVRSLELSAGCWLYLNEPDRLPPRVAQRLNALSQTASASSKPLLLWALVRFAQENKQLMVAPDTDTRWCKGFEDLVAQAERFAVLVILANGRLSSVGQSDMNSSAYALAHPGQPIYIRHPHLISPSGAADAVLLARDHLASIVENGGLEPEQFLDARFAWAGYFDVDAVQTTIADRLRSQNGFYNWQFGKLLIYLWEEYLRGDRGRPVKRTWEKFAWDESVEHIYPQNPHSQWSDEVTVDARSKRAKSTITNSLGNLLLLSSSVNSQLSNQPYVPFGDLPGKRQRFLGGSYSEIQVGRLCEKWGVVQIAARGIAMMRLAQRTWGFEVVAEDEALTAWLPFLFGDVAESIQAGDYTNDRKVDGRALNPWVKKFEDL